MKRILLIILITASSIVYPQSTFYVQKGKMITKIENEDPYKLDVKEWQIRLYKKDQPTNGNSFWAVIKGSTIDKVNASLKISQEFELSSNEFFGKGRVQNEVDTHFNPLGPIAIIDSKNNLIPIDEEQSRIREFSDRLIDSYETYEEVKGNMDIIIKGEDNIYGNIGNNFKEYTEGLKDNTILVSTLRKLLNTNIQQYISKINQSINQIDKNFDTAENNVQKIRSKYAENSDAVDIILKKELARTQNSTENQVSNSVPNSVSRFYLLKIDITNSYNPNESRVRKKIYVIYGPVLIGISEDSFLRTEKEIYSKIEKQLNIKDCDKHIERFTSYFSTVFSIEEAKKEFFQLWGEKDDLYEFIELK